MTDSERLSGRLDGVVARRRDKQGGGPVRAGQTMATVVNAMRKHVSDPTKVRFATDEEIAAKDAQDRLADRQAKVDRLMTRIPGKYREADMSASTEHGAQGIAWVRAYRAAIAAGDAPRSLVIMGPKGVGKTWLACGIAKSLMDPDAPVPVTYTTVAEMLETLRGPFRPGLDVDMTQYLVTPVLLLDDFGAENLTDWSREQLYRLSHGRDHNGLPVIVTTNLSGPQIWDRYESRTVERLFNGAARIDMKGDSRRVLPF
jgi:DNA replication protein DnaC